ncbi:ATP-binding protein [Streptomyces sp. NPDC046805]|uniref:ATP-binding protein n=1 Tax=Streptomyces sp. NPDC046805 TaxID=3155134 RepID=UPI0033FD5A00
MPRPVAHRFPRADAAVPEARSFLRQVLADWNISDRLDDALNCLSELATNAVVHAGASAGHFDVEVGFLDGCLRIEVRDLSRQTPTRKSPDADDPTGRGLLIVDALSDGWGVEPCVRGGKTVWTEFKIEAEQGLSAGVSPW